MQAHCASEWCCGTIFLIGNALQYLTTTSSKNGHLIFDLLVFSSIDRIRLQVAYQIDRYTECAITYCKTTFSLTTSLSDWMQICVAFIYMLRVTL